ncbi:MAG: hypothetical protein ACOC2Y_05035 [Spirochaetota bacterium]
MAQTILLGLTSTEKDRIPAFVDDVRHSDVREIALFPTVLDRSEREELYAELASIPGLRIPHVHLRTDFDESEMRFVVKKFSVELFNIHPRSSGHPFGDVPTAFAKSVYVENVEVPVDDAELEGLGGMCPDYSHLENARLVGRSEYVAVTERQLRRHRIGCCHVSAIRLGDPSPWSGGADHHNYKTLSDFDYLARYAYALPDRWISLELENSLNEQLEAARYVRELLLDGLARSAAD